MEDEGVLGKAYDARLVKRLWPYARPHMRLFAVATMLVLLQIAAEQAAPLLMSLAIDGPMTALAKDGSDAAAWDTLHGLSLIFILVLVADFALRYFQTYALNVLGQRVIFGLRSHLYRHLQGLPLRFYDRKPVGVLVTRTTNDIEAIGEIFSAGLVTMLADVLKIIVILGIMFALNFELALVVLAVFPVMFLITSIFRHRTRTAYRVMRTKLAELNGFLVEALGGLTVTRIFAQEKRQEERYDKRNAAYRDACLDTVQNFALFYPVIEFISTVSIGLLLWYGHGLIADNTIAAGAFVAFFVYTQRLFRPMRELSEHYTVLQSAMASTERVMQLLDERNEIVDPPAPATINRVAMRGEIEFRDVWFAYQADRWVLKGVSFRVPPGGTLALVGATGSGKTTIINLLCRFYDAQKGQILIDGVDIREMRLDDLRSCFGLVLQDVFLFAGTVVENLRLGDLSISRERVIEAAKDTGVDSFVSRLEKGYDSVIAERGATLSAGERQLIAFARALAFDPRILILDEATANIDSESEARIQQAIERTTHGRTTVAIAHRLSTIRHAGEILVLHKGEVAERGSHDELLGRKGRYHQLYMLQFEELVASKDS
ncbi:MAG: ABC transporter ATP-binding protein/permease [Planctomycetes bacterium]|nr:ABC transporter ATP-binding protein/permease [Planctomycetota bacterium]